MGQKDAMIDMIISMQSIKNNLQDKLKENKFKLPNKDIYS